MRFYRHVGSNTASSDTVYFEFTVKMTMQDLEHILATHQGIRDSRKRHIPERRPIRLEAAVAMTNTDATRRVRPSASRVSLLSALTHSSSLSTLHLPLYPLRSPPRRTHLCVLGVVLQWGTLCLSDVITKQMETQVQTYL